jgi:Flp pilus assembly protein TadB
VPELFWTLVKIGGYFVLVLVSLIVALAVALLSLVGVWLVIDWRRERAKARQRARENTAMHEAIQDYLRQHLTVQE